MVCDTPTPIVLYQVITSPTIHYYRCRTCGHVWTTKGGTFLAHITPLSENRHKTT